MTSKDYLKITVPGSEMQKQATAGDFAKGVGMMAAYSTPGLGGILSGRDALRNLGGLGSALLSGNWKRLGTQALKFGGNSLMALADFIPGGNFVRGAVRGGRLAKVLAKSPKLAKLFKNTSKAMKEGEKAMGVARGAIGMGARDLKHLRKLRKKKLFDPEAIKMVENAQDFAKFTPTTRVSQAISRAKTLDKKIGGLKNRIAKMSPGSKRAALENQLQAAKEAHKYYRKVGAAGTGLGGKLSLKGGNIGANFHGYANHLMSRVAPGVNRTAARVANKTGLNSWGKMQTAGLGTWLSADIPNTRPRQRVPSGQVVPKSPIYPEDYYTLRR